MSIVKNRIPILLNHIRWKQLAGERQIYIFGSGEAGRLLLEYLRAVDIEPAGFIDNNKDKWGLDFLGLKIFDPQVLAQDVFIIIASSWYQEISEQLLQLEKRKGLDFVDDYEIWFDTLCKYRFTNNLDFVVVDEADFYSDVNHQANQIETNIPDFNRDEIYQPNEAEIHFFVHNSMHAGDIILTRPFINELRLTYPKARISLECPENRKYLWEDLKLPIMGYHGKEYQGIEPTPNCPPEALFINIWFGIFQDILDGYGLSYANNVHTFNRFMYQCHLQNQLQLPVKDQSPMVEFYRRPVIPFRVKENGVLVENGQVFSGQSGFPLHDSMPEIVQSFPDLNFYFAATPGITGPNVVDCSGLDLIAISELSNRCIGFLTLGSGVNAATQTENNRYKPRCIVGWNYQWKVWYTPENPTFFAQNITDIKRFLLNLCGQQPPKKLSALSTSDINVEAKRFCKFLRSKTEVEKCTKYLHENGLASHAVACKDWEIAHIISDLADGNFLDMGSSDSYILKNAVIKGIKGEKYGIDLRAPNVPLASVKYLIGDLLEVQLPEAYFQNITCLSVLEHGVDIKRFAVEASRLLSENGTLYVTFDYWDPKITANMQLYGLEWNILAKNDVQGLVAECKNQGMYLTEDIDWTVENPLINENYWAPAKVGYTFGMLSFTKRN
jgi:hypothetical protein